MRSDRLKTVPKALLFDMDGTLTKPLLDFPRIKSEMDIGVAPILEAMAAMNPARRAECEAILGRHETSAATRSTLNDGCVEILAWIEAIGLWSAVITRNSSSCVRIVFERHALNFPVCITRDDAPFKPDPLPLLMACDQLNVAPADAWMVGDGQYDIEAARAAGVNSIWLSHGRTRTFEAPPWREVNDLAELLLMFKREALPAERL